MNVVFYSPFPEGSFKSDLLDYSKKAQNRQHKAANKGKEYTSLNYDVGQKNQLAQFGSNTRLYVIGHGEYLTTHICGDTETTQQYEGFDSHFKRLAITAPCLVEQLQAAGLHKDVKEVRIWACTGAKRQDSFAYRFGELMLTAYPNTVVYGYTGYMCTVEGRKRGVYFATDLDSFPAHTFRVNVTARLKKATAPKKEVDEEDFEFADDPFGASNANVVALKWDK